MLYAEHMLRLFDNIRREPIILKNLKQSMPESLEGLYDTILADLQRHTAADKQQALRWLLCWVAFAHRPLTLTECSCLLDLVPSNSLDVEEELQGQQLVRLIKIADPEERYQEDDGNTNEDVIDLQGQTDPDAAYDDRDLPLKFQERSMRGYFRSASSDEKGLRTPARVAHWQIFTTTSKILCGEVNMPLDSLQKYAAQYWIWHVGGWNFLAKSSKPDDDEEVAGLEAVAAIMTNHGDCAKTIENLGLNYEDVRGDLTEKYVLDNIASIASTAITVGDKLTETTLAWAKGVVEDRGSAFMVLARAHVVNWFQSEDHKAALHLYNVVRSVISLVGTTPGVLATRPKAFNMSWGYPDCRLHPTLH
jgi:hypothetical protein